MTEKQEQTVKKKVKAKAGEKVGVYITLEGTYYSKTVSHCIPKQYKIELQLIDNPDYELPSDQRLHHVGFRKLAPHYFESRPHEYPDYAGVRTCKLVNVTRYGSNKQIRRKDIPIMEMDIDELVMFCAKENLNANPKYFPTIESARLAVRDEMQNRKLAEFEAEKQQQMDELKEQQKFEDVDEILKFSNVM